MLTKVGIFCVGGCLLVTVCSCETLRAQTKKLTEATSGNCHAEFTLSGHEILSPDLSGLR